MPDICGAKTKKGTICKKPAGYGTNHFGTGRCKFHGGMQQKEPNKFLELQLDPDIRDRTMELLKDPDILNSRVELAALKARFEQVAFEESVNINQLVKMALAIARIASTIQEMEQGKQHYLHVTVTSTIIGAFADIGMKYITDPYQRVQFKSDMESVIRKSINASSARAVASSALVPDFVDAEAVEVDG